MKKSLCLKKDLGVKTHHVVTHTLWTRPEANMARNKQMATEKKKKKFLFHFCTKKTKQTKTPMIRNTNYQWYHQGY